jgi:type I restriction enzyme S subunit
MNAEILLSQFDRIIEAPGAVSRLRQFILELAVRGKLVEQDPIEEPASLLLKRISAKRDALLAGKLLRASRAEYGAIAVGNDFELPKGWARSTINETCELQTGATPDRNRAEYFGGKVRWLVSGDINQREIFECSGRITEAGLDASNCKILPPNSVLMALNGQGKTRGTVALLRVPAACNQSLVAIIPLLEDCLMPEFLYWNLRSRYLAIRHLTGHEDRRGLNMKLISCFEISLPPKSEQRRIVKRIAELMVRCDELETAEAEREARRDLLVGAATHRINISTDRQELREQSCFFINHFQRLTLRAEHIKQLRQSILNLAVHGRLLGQIHEDNSAVLSSDQFTSFDVSNLSGPSGSLSFPAHWSVEPLEKIALAIVDCPHSTPKWTAEGRICVRTNQFRPGYLDLSDVRFVSEATYLERTQRLEPIANDILYSREGGILGVACRVPSKTKLCLGQRMMLIRAGAGTDSAFLEMVLNSPLITRIARDLTTGGAAPRVNVATVKAYPIPLPPLGEQRHIVAKVGELMGLCERLENGIATFETGNRHLLNAVLHEALTPTTVEAQ